QVRNPVYDQLGQHPSIHLLDPVSYPVFIWLAGICDIIISDSGGIQEEAPTFKKLVLITRDLSERMEGVEAGIAFLVGTNKDKLVSEALKLIKNPPDFEN